MSYSLAAMFANQTAFTLTYQNNSTDWGQCEIVAPTIAPNANVLAFNGTSNATFSGCQGTVVYGFTDQSGNAQTVQMSYNDPFSGSNSVTITYPNGMTGGSYVPSHGSYITANFSLSGTPSAEPKDVSSR